ncbi:MAG: late competence development ComFB family protein [Desulfobulbaceae bacterium]|nr:late competence development ComFB family protein [Desulfobulbaceae bacterium]MDY0350585.1 late competence development ComFB family protein [Desulfobulbaceae bacterium]
MTDRQNKEDRWLRFVDLSRISNKNEKRVIQAMEKILATIDDWEPEVLDIQDIYALALNSLPPRYVQEGTIVFNERVKNDEVEKVVRDAIEKVKTSPNY